MERWVKERCVARQCGSFRACSRVVSMSVCLCVAPLCGRVIMGQSDGSRGGSCHGNRGCRLFSQDLSCPTVLQTSLLSYQFDLVYFSCLHITPTYSSSPLSLLLAPFPCILQSPVLLLLSPSLTPALCYSCNRYK